jgi:hypothetical protein
MEEGKMKAKQSVLSVGLVLGVVTSLLPAVSAAASKPAAVSQTVFEQRLNDEDLDAAHFDVNRDLGRAWIDVVLRPDYTTDEQPEVVQRALHGLYYDPARKEVIYRSGAKDIVCAEDDTNFLGMTSLKETGQCDLQLSSEKRPIDDGFNVHNETVGRVVFQALKAG